MQVQRKIAVAGATGRVGRHVVDVLKAEGHEVVAMSRSRGVDIVTGDGLAERPGRRGVHHRRGHRTPPEQQAAIEFFTTAARNLQEAWARAGVQRIVVVSIIGCDRFTAGYGAAKVARERATLSGPVPARVLRAGPREENLVDMAIRLMARRGDPVKIEGVSDAADPDRDVYVLGALLPGPDATLAGPTFEEWLDATS
jgi:uncharacterized protein YbjT (DUF2867 family)